MPETQQKIIRLTSFREPTFETTFPIAVSKDIFEAAIIELQQVITDEKTLAKALRPLYAITFLIKGKTRAIGAPESEAKDFGVPSFSLFDLLEEAFEYLLFVAVKEVKVQLLNPPSSKSYVRDFWERNKHTDSFYIAPLTGEQLTTASTSSDIEAAFFKAKETALREDISLETILSLVCGEDFPRETISLPKK